MNDHTNTHIFKITFKYFSNYFKWERIKINFNYFYNYFKRERIKWYLNIFNYFKEKEESWAMWKIRQVLTPLSTSLPRIESIEYLEDFRVVSIYTI